MLITKASVRFKRFTPAMMTMLSALYAADAVKIPGQPEDLVITSANDSEHVAKSRHYTDEALDVRSHTFSSAAAKEEFRAELEASLGEKFRVLLESAGKPAEHFHLQVRRGLSFP